MSARHDGLLLASLPASACAALQKQEIWVEGVLPTRESAGAGYTACCSRRLDLARLQSPTLHIGVVRGEPFSRRITGTMEGCGAASTGGGGCPAWPSA